MLPEKKRPVPGAVKWTLIALVAAAIAVPTGFLVSRTGDEIPPWARADQQLKAEQAQLMQRETQSLRSELLSVVEVTEGHARGLGLGPRRYLPNLQERPVCVPVQSIGAIVATENVEVAITAHVSPGDAESKILGIRSPGWFL